MKKNQKIESCLDEIEVSHSISNHNMSNDAKRNLNGWVKKQKTILKELGYEGKIPRKAKNDQYNS